MAPEDYGKWMIIYPYFQESEHYWIKGWGEVPEGIDACYYYMDGKPMLNKERTS